MADAPPNANLPMPSRTIFRRNTDCLMIRCPHCHTLVMTIVRVRLCGLLSSLHFCPQCDHEINSPEQFADAV